MKREEKRGRRKEIRNGGERGGGRGGNEWEMREKIGGKSAGNGE